jgi:hypothetical protein
MVYLLTKHGTPRATMTTKRLSNKEFEEFLHALFVNDPLKVKYQKPDTWRKHPTNNEG